MGRHGMTATPSNGAFWFGSCDGMFSLAGRSEALLLVMLSEVADVFAFRSLRLRRNWRKTRQTCRPKALWRCLAV